MIRERFSKAVQPFLSTDDFMIVQEHYDPEENLANESLFCLTNGYLGIRGSFEEGTIKSLPYINFNVYYLILIRKVKDAFRCEEMRGYFAIVISCARFKYA